jgi:hypothetical protein
VSGDRRDTIASRHDSDRFSGSAALMTVSVWLRCGELPQQFDGFR